MKVKVANAFSLNMLDIADRKVIEIRRLTLDEVCDLLKNGFESYVGHESTALILTEITGIEIPFDRKTLVMKEDDVLVIAQYRGPRLEEGCTRLPDGATIEWYMVREVK